MGFLTLNLLFFLSIDRDSNGDFRLASMGCMERGQARSDSPAFFTSPWGEVSFILTVFLPLTKQTITVLTTIFLGPGRKVIGPRVHSIYLP